MAVDAEELRLQLSEITEDAENNGHNLVQCFALEVDTKDAQQALRLTSQALPLSLFNLGHLKRAKPGFMPGKLLILLAPVQAGEAEVQKIKSELQATSLHTVNVPQSFCATPDGWDRASTSWPFRRPRPTLPNTHPSKLSPESLLRSFLCMQHAVKEAKMAKQKGLPPIGTVVVDNTGETIAATHAANHLCAEAYGFSKVSRCSEFPGVNPLHHSVMLSIDAVASREREAQSPGKQRSDNDPYLLSGCDVYTTHEPCTMCSMALLHSRVRAVYYAVPNPTYGGLGSRYRINVQPGLNHRFAVYRGLCAAEVLQLQSNDWSVDSGSKFVTQSIDSNVTVDTCTPANDAKHTSGTNVCIE
eukprot:EG_transcript_15025